jgi:hypothetical protein
MSTKKIAKIVAYLKKLSSSELNQFWNAAIEAGLPGVRRLWPGEACLQHRLDVAEKELNELAPKPKTDNIDGVKTRQNVAFFILRLKRKSPWKELSELSKKLGPKRSAYAIRIAISRMRKNLGYRTPADLLFAYDKDPETFKKKYVNSLHDCIPISVKIPGLPMRDWTPSQNGTHKPKKFSNKKRTS